MTPQGYQRLDGHGYMGCKDSTDYMASILSMAIAIICITYDNLHCNSDTQKAITGIKYRVRDLVALITELDKIGRQQ